MTTFLISLQAEFMKIRRSAAFWLTIAGSAFLPALFFIMYVSKPDEFAKRFGQHPWMGHILMGFQGASFFLWPMFIIIVASMVTQIEYRNNTWKQVLASPLTVGDVYFAKYIVIQCMILCAYHLFDAEMLLVGPAAELFRQEYNYMHASVPFRSILLLDIKSYIAIQVISTIQYCISLRYKNLNGAIGTGLALIIAGLMMIPWD